MTSRPCLIGRSGIKAGERATARRLLIVLAMLASTTTPALVERADDDAIVGVREHGGVYTISARFPIAEPAELAIAVLTDYEQIPRFMPDVRVSRVRERTAGLVRLEQEATARFLLFSKRIHLVLAVEEAPLLIRFKDECGKSFERYEGSWTISEVGNHATIRYELVAKPAFDVPGFLASRLFKRDATTTIARLRTEIAARAAGRATP